MKTNAYAIHSVVAPPPPAWGGANFLPKIHLGRHGKNLDSWSRGEGLPNLWTPIAFRGGLEKGTGTLGNTVQLCMHRVMFHSKCC